jgi:hypothetical protein
MGMKCIDDGCYDLRHGTAERQRKIQTYRFRFKRLDTDNLGSRQVSGKFRSRKKIGNTNLMR